MLVVKENGREEHKTMHKFYLIGVVVLELLRHRLPLDRQIESSLDSSVSVEKTTNARQILSTI